MHPLARTTTMPIENRMLICKSALEASLIEDFLRIAYQRDLFRSSFFEYFSVLKIREEIGMKMSMEKIIEKWTKLGNRSGSICLSARNRKPRSPWRRSNRNDMYSLVIYHRNRVAFSFSWFRGEKKQERRENTAGDDSQRRGTRHTCTSV